MLKALLSALALIMVSAPALASPTFYRDDSQNLYFEGLPPQTLMKVQYFGSDRFGRRHQQGWMYRDGRRECVVHMVWPSRKFLAREGQTFTIRGTQIGDVSVLIDNFTTLPYLPWGDPCSGANVNDSLPWVDLGAGIKIRRTIDPCKWKFEGYGRAENCKPAEVFLVAGLTPAAYRVSVSVFKSRFVKSDECGYLKLGNTNKWPAAPKDRFGLFTNYSLNNPNFKNFGVFNRGDAAYREFNQIPKCFDGVRFLPALN